MKSDKQRQKANIIVQMHSFTTKGKILEFSYYFVENYIKIYIFVLNRCAVYLYFMNLDEDLIWETILESAKLRFDYNRYIARFEPYEMQLSQNLLLEVIVGIAAGKNELILAWEISNEFVIFGKDVPFNKIINFIDEKKELFQHEVQMVRYANEQLEIGKPPSEIYPTVNQYLLH